VAKRLSDDPAKLLTKQAYLAALRVAGYRSWKAANERRVELITAKMSRRMSREEKAELVTLQNVAERRLEYTCYEFHKAVNETVDKLASKMGERRDA
jgi:hypothetical protein